jgi:cobyrinic acid a,c-diamide synthase
LARAIVIAAPTSTSGKTVVTLGLIRALRRQGLRVASAKVGPDYIDPRFHAHASGRPCPNLDPWAMGETGCAALLEAASGDADLIIIEGVMGLFDGPHGASGSTADLAAALGLPVVLVVDARHQSQSLAALVHGFATYRPDIALGGVIANRIASDRHAEIVAAALGDRLLGMVRADRALELPSRHLGLVQADENQELETFIESAASAVARETVLDRLANQASALPTRAGAPPALAPLGQTIAVARDVAFGFSYPHLRAGGGPAPQSASSRPSPTRRPTAKPTPSSSPAATRNSMPAGWPATAVSCRACARPTAWSMASAAATWSSARV